MEKRKSNFVKLLDKVSKHKEGEYFKNVDYSVKVKLSIMFSLSKQIEKDCKLLTELWEKDFDFGLTRAGKFTKYEPKNGRVKQYELVLIKRISANLDFFTYSIISFFDILAKYTKFMYNQISLATRGFSDQKKWFINHKSVDPMYADYLNKNLAWYDIFKDKRDEIVHNLAILIIPERMNGLFNVVFCPTFEEHNRIDIQAFVKMYSIKLSSFLEFYGQYFITKFG